VVLVTAVMGGFGARAAFAAPATVVVSFDHTTIPAGGGPVTMTATVTSSQGPPTGTVTFYDRSPGGDSLGLVTLLPTTAPNTTSAVLEASMAARPYAIEAVYSPSYSVWGVIDGATSPTYNLAPADSTPKHATTVSLSSPSLTVTAGTPVTLTATVSAGIGNGVPTGTVTFSDVTSGTPVPLGGGNPVTLVNGAAQLTVLNFAIGEHSVIASYNGDSANDGSASPPLLLVAQAPVDVRVQTLTTVTVTPATFAAGDRVTIIATVVQQLPGGVTQPASGGHVDFWSHGANDNGGPLPSAELGQSLNDIHVAPNQAVIQVSTLITPGPTEITASYFGNIVGLDTPGSATVSVLPRRASTAIAYTGDPSVVFGHTAHLSATLTDPGNGSGLADRSMTFTIGSQSCTATPTNASGQASCSLSVTQPAGATTVNVEVAETLDTEGVSTAAAFAIFVAPTSISVGFQPRPSMTDLTATLLTEGVPLADQPVTLSLGGGSCNATTNAAGSATCNVPTITGPPTALLSAAYAGDAGHALASTSKTVQLVVTSSLAYTGAVTSSYHGTPLLSAKLTDGIGAPVVGRTVTFTLGTQGCNGTTNLAGVASCSILSVNQDAGPYTLAVQYAGDTVSTSASTAAPFQVTPAPTALTLGTPVIGANATLSATLKETASGAMLSGKTVTLSLGTAASTCTATTLAGVASCSVPIPSGSAATLTGSFAGETNYGLSNDSKNVTLLKPTSLIYTGATTADYHDSATLSAILTSGAGPLPDMLVTLTLGSQGCTATTDPAGIASCSLVVSQQQGSQPVGASFPQTGLYLASTSSAGTTFAITREQTTLTVGLVGPVLRESTLTLTGTLLEDGLTPILGRTVTLTLGTKTCSGVTDTAGVATCTVAGTDSLGPTPSISIFTADDFYRGATASGSAMLYSLAPGGGSFVVGNESAAGSVTFWGAKWSKLNHVSGGGAPDAFKGFALVAPMTCGTRWTTGPGNSPVPPAALPAYMAVLVTSSVTKSGSSLSGTTAHIVIVKTDAGYKGDPGHAGTGNVVATVC
jgi:hypothetical protein